MCPNLSVPRLLILALSLSLSLALVPSTARGQNFGQNNGDQPRTRGIVKAIAPDHLSFVVTDDRTNITATVTLNSSTTLMLGGRESEFVDVVVPDEMVIAMIGPNGVATDIYNRNRNQRMPLSQLKELLGVGDEEAIALGPLIQRVRLLERDLLFGGRGGGGGGRNNSPPTAIQTATEALQQSVDNKNATTEELKSKLVALREQRARLQSQLDRARAELQSLLTVRQEAVLVQMGVLD